MNRRGGSDGTDSSNSGKLERNRLLAIGRRVRLARGARNVLAIAVAAGLSPPSVYRVENAVGSCSIDTMCALASALGVDVGWLLRGDVSCPGCGQAVGMSPYVETAMQHTSC